MPEGTASGQTEQSDVFWEAAKRGVVLGLVGSMTAISTALIAGTEDWRVLLGAALGGFALQFTTRVGLEGMGDMSRARNNIVLPSDIGHGTVSTTTTVPSMTTGTGTVVSSETVIRPTVDVIREATDQ